jgi:hypothetical protein
MSVPKRRLGWRAVQLRIFIFNYVVHFNAVELTFFALFADLVTGFNGCRLSCLSIETIVHLSAVFER